MSEQQPPARPAVTEPAPEAVAPAPAARGRGRQTVGDMVRSLFVVLVLVFVVVALNAQDDSGEKLQPLDYSGTLAQAQDTAPYDVLAPIGLPDSWVPTSARTGRDGDAVTWHLGLVTPAEHYAAVEQSNGPMTAFVDSFVAGATKSGFVTISGARWQRLDGGQPEDRALVLRGKGVTTMVTGGATFGELQTLASALRGG